MVIKKQLPTEDEIIMMTDEERKQYVTDYLSGVYELPGHKPSFIQKLKYKLGGLFNILVGIIFIAIVYGIINLVLVGGQALWHSGDKARMEVLQQELDRELAVIQQFERKIQNETITDPEYNEYTRRIDEYNLKIEEYNELAEQVGTTWYVVPVPGGKSN